MTAPNARERILPRLIEEEMQQSFINYSMSVIVSRALPDVRDGLKPVHRRILYAMNELGLVPGRPYKKSATVVGDVLGKYHPHGDSSVYDALVRMVQEFSLRYPLIDGQGNFGSVDGDPAAAYRYTEARLTRVAVAMLEDIDKNTVNFQSNFDDRLQEPTVLPSKIPNLLVNGSSGIAVGMATNIPPHNLREVAKAVEMLVDNPEATIADLRKAIKGPDFPTGAFIYGREGIKEPTRPAAAAWSCGPGPRSRSRSRSGRSQIVVTEIPYQVNKENLVKAIAELAMEKKIEGHLRGERRIRQGRHADRHRAQARRDPQRGAEPALQAHRDAVHLRRDHAGARQGRAEGHEPQGAARALHRAPPRDHRPADPVRPRCRAGPGAHPRRPQDRRRQHRRGHQDHPRLGRHARGRRQAAQAVRAEREAERRDPQHAARQAHRPRDRQAGRRAEGSAGHDQGPQVHPGQQAQADGDPQERDGRGGGSVRRRAPHRDRRRPGRVHGRGPDRRRGHGHHHLPHRLHQADPGQHLQEAAPRRTRPERRRPEGGRLGRAPLHRQHPRLPALLHRHRPALLAQGPRDPAGRPRGARQAGRELHRDQADRAGRGAGPGARVRRRQVPDLRHPAGHGEEDAALGVRERAHQRHQRHQHRRGRRA